MADGPGSIKPEHVVHLAYMECFASCLLTYVRSLGGDPRLLLLDYWNLGYERGVLLSSKDARHLPVRQLFGVRMVFASGDVESVKRSVSEGRPVIFFCKASKLPYFPPAYLGMEGAGFRHAILLYGWDEAGGRFLVADPVVHSFDTLSPSLAAEAGATRTDREETHYFQLDASAMEDRLASIGQMLAFCARRIYFTYSHASAGEAPQSKWDVIRDNLFAGSTGLKAWAKFERDLAASVHWDRSRRNGWTVQNAKVVSSIRHLRQQIADSYLSLGSFDRSAEVEMQSRVQRIQTLWNQLSLHLLRYGNHGDPSAVPGILEHAAKVKWTELTFLQWLYAFYEKGAHDGYELE